MRPVLAQCGPPTAKRAEDAVYVRIIRGHTQPGQVAEVVRRWQAFIVPQLRKAPGLRRVYFLGDGYANAVAAVSVWDSLPDAAALDRAMHAFMTQERELMRAQPTIEDYEVLGEFSPGEEP